MRNDKPEPSTTVPPGVTIADARGRSEPTPIPVRSLFLRAGLGVEFPGLAGHRTVTADPELAGTTKRHWEIDFLPWARQYRVTYYPGGADAVMVRLLHETFVMAEPA